MFCIYKTSLVFVSLVCYVFSATSCRECTGLQSLQFETSVTQEQAKVFLHGSLGACATGSDYYIEWTNSSACKAPVGNSTTIDQQVKVCKNWLFNLNIMHYCGSGHQASLSKGEHCIAGICAVRDDLNMACGKNIDCRGDCDAAKCAL